MYVAYLRFQLEQKMCFYSWDKSMVTDDFIICSFMQNPQHMVFHAFEGVVLAGSHAY